MLCHLCAFHLTPEVFSDAHLTIAICQDILCFNYWQLPMVTMSVELFFAFFVLLARGL